MVYQGLFNLRRNILNAALPRIVKFIVVFFTLIFSIGTIIVDLFPKEFIDEPNEQNFHL